MNPRWLRALPLVIAAGVCGFVIVGQRQPAVARLFENLEWDLYDWRVRLSANRMPMATNRLATVEIDDSSVEAIQRETGWWWPIPRRYYARLIHLLNEGGARVIGLDIKLVDAMQDVPGVPGSPRTSDEALAEALRQCTNVVLAAWDTGGGLAGPLPLFRTNAAALGDTTKLLEADNMPRRVEPFREDPVLGRIWNLGLEMGARALGLDLAGAVVEADRIILRDDRGLERVLRLDRDGRFLVPWTFRHNHRGLQKARLVDALAEQETAAAWPGWNRAPWKDRVVLVYSTASGSNVSDVGPTPFSAFDHHGITLLNIANAVLTGVSIRRLPPAAEVGIVLLMALAAAGLSWRLRAMWATAAVMVLGAAYLGLSVWLFGACQLWLPCVWPLLGALLTTHVLMIVYRILVEWTEAPVRTAFGRVVSTNVVDLLVRQATRNFVGTRRTVTVVFADIRGFTALAEVAHRRAEESVNAGGLEGWEADAVVDAEARETLETVNVYLNTVADVFKAHGGTLDKYIGDCLTAFWGAPLSIREHAVRAVRATILALEAVQVLNESRRAENERRTRDNTVRSAEGHGNLPLAPILEIGIGVNTGPVLVGFMGAKRHIWNYSIFGREVIITSRLERLAGHDVRAPILVSGSTHAELRRLDPELAARFRPVGPVMIRGIKEPIEIHELT